MPSKPSSVKRYGTIPDDSTKRAKEEDAPCPTDEYGNPLYCWARRRQGTGRCHRPAGWATPHPGAGQCKYHGGNMPNNIKHAHLIIARQEVNKLGLSIDIDPHEALLANVRLHGGHVAFFQRLVSQSDPDDLLTGGEGAIWYSLLRDAQKELTVAASSAARAGVEERQIRLAENQAENIAAGMRGMLEDLGIEITPEVLQVVRRRLLELSNIDAATASAIFGEGQNIIDGDFQEVEEDLKSSVLEIVTHDAKSLVESNPYLQNPATRKASIEQNVTTSSAIEHENGGDGDSDEDS